MTGGGDGTPSPVLGSDRSDPPAGLSQGERRRGHAEEADAAALVLRYQAGEADGLSALHRLLEPAIRSVVGRYRPAELPSALSMQDVSQQSWVVLAELAGRWRPGGSFLAYFFRSFPLAIARYVRRARSAGPTAIAEAEAGYLASDPAENALWAEQLADLSRGERLAFLLHTVDQRDFDAIGCALGVSRATAHRLYQRARGRLAARLDGPGGPRQPPMVRLVRALHAGVRRDGCLPGRRRVLAVAALTRSQYEALMAQLQAAGAVEARASGASGRLVGRTPAETLARLAGGG